MTDSKDFNNDFEIKWCPGCGNFGILEALKKALAAQDLSPSDVILVSGIGQAGKTPHFLHCNYFHGLHGRALCVATGVKLANHAAPVVVNMGDGDCYGEGGNHFIHALRRDIDVTLIVSDNRVYGLTKGQASPTTQEDMKTPTQPHGVMLHPFDPLSVALVSGCRFVARGFPGENDHLADLIQKGMQHKGLALIDVASPCVSFNHLNTWEWYNQRVKKIGAADHDPTDLDKALALAREWDKAIPIGILYQKEGQSFHERLGLEDPPLVDRGYAPGPMRRIVNRLWR